MKSSSFCFFRDRWYIMGNKAYNYIFHKVSFDFIVSILLESAGQGNKPSSDSLSFSEKLDAGSGGGGGGGRGRGGDAEGVIFLSPFYPPGQTPVGMYSLPLPPPPRNFFLLTQDGGLSFPEDIRRNHVVVAEELLNTTDKGPLASPWEIKLSLNFRSQFASPALALSLLKVFVTLTGLRLTTAKGHASLCIMK